MGNTVAYAGYDVSDQEPSIEKFCIDLRGRCSLTISFWMPVHFFFLECFRKVLTVPCTLKLELWTSWTADGRWAGKYILYLLWQPEIRYTVHIEPILTPSQLVAFNIHFSIIMPCGQVQRLAAGWTVWGSNLGGAVVLRARPDKGWGPPRLLYNGHRVIPPGSKTAGAWRWPTHPCLALRLKKV